MCFTKTQSFINVVLLTLGAIYVYPNYRLTIVLIFLSLKDLIQGFLYHYQNNKKMKNILSVLSWVHICFQPLFVNIFMSNFSKDKVKYWNFIFIICLLYGIYTLTTLNELDIQNDPDYVNNDDDFYSKETTSYIGKYHVGYKFSRDNDKIFFPIIYFILIVLPSLFTNSRIYGILWTIFIVLISIIFKKIRNGEIAAIWCFLSIIFVLPLSIINK